jgi:ubiquitin-activating enzyme E1
MQRAAAAVEDQVAHRCLSLQQCVAWARLQFELYFSHGILQLLHNFPAAQTTVAGAPFWAGTKRMPRTLAFDADEPLHVDFVCAAAHLQVSKLH